MMLRATGSMRAGGMTLFGKASGMKPGRSAGGGRIENGDGPTIGEARLLRSPVSWLGFGAAPVKIIPWTKRTISMLTKKNVRSLPL